MTRLTSAVFFAVLLLTFGYGVSFPLLSILLEQSGVGAARIGLNAAMPALGWLLVTPFLPVLHRVFTTQQLLLAFLVLSLMGLACLALTTRFDLWLLGRFAFGGGLGVLFRVLEYWLNATSRSATRGRTIGLYAFFFLLGIAIGSLSQPQFGTAGLTAFAAVGVPILLGGALLVRLPLNRPPSAAPTDEAPIRTTFAAAPLAMAAVICYGLFEDVPAYLLSVYTLRVGLGENLAAYTLTAFALGNLLGAVPLGVMSDRLGRTPVLIGCATVALGVAVTLPVAAATPQPYLLSIALWGACAGELYVVGLATLGDHFSGPALISANALFGTIYAAAALLGPLINGSAMQVWDPHGLLVSCALIFSGFLLITSMLALHRRVPNTVN
ncbi:MAG: MFS transporter [Shimia sp.]|uniref:MFS transporter n=1 Tax=Shimia sp. TaxID=1954381 RepID=UPI0025EAEA5B|nr:MFS transporter [Shimia sp.]MCH2069235.1 MFS transporter [Shimia sp.]